jgi:DNA-binding response OmpR family regulator
MGIKMANKIDVDGLSGLKSLYLRQLKERLATLEQAMVDLQLGLPDSQNYNALEFEVHRLNGTGATYGFPAISSTADKLEAHLRSPVCDPGLVIKLLHALISTIAATLVKEAANAPAGRTAIAPSPRDGRGPYKPTILVADDDAAILNLVMQLLSPLAHIECVDSGEAAIAAIERRRFDLVILDCEMPGVNGLDVLTHISHSEAILRSPVMMLSAVRDPIRVCHMITAGAQNYLVKPIAPAQLIERASYLLDQKQKIVMVVDDDPLIREIFRKRFTQRGHEVLLASNGAQALSLARKAHPQAIVLDWQMPRMDGIQVLQELRREEETRSIPVVMLSARGTSDDMYAGYREGADAYIAKPFVPDQVIDCCEGLLQPRDIAPLIAAAKAAWQDCAFV